MIRILELPEIRIQLPCTAVMALMFLLVNCNPSKAPAHSSAKDELDAYFRSQFPADEPGGAVLFMRNDSVLFEKGYGIANLKTNEPITSETLFNIGSITKTFVANSILLLREQGKLSLDDSLAAYFPKFENTSIARRVRIKHLLTHTSGLPDIRNVSSDTVFFLTAKDQENWDPILKTDTLLFEPGSEFSYSNPAYNGLALIIEKASGMKWQKFVDDNIFTPAGMELSTITDGPHPEKGVNHAYVLNHGEWTEDDYGEEPTFPAAGNGGVWSSVRELAFYERAIQQSLFLPEPIIRESRTIQKLSNWKGTRPFEESWSWFTPEQNKGIVEPMIGWSWFIGKTDKGLKVVGHTGSQGGFLCNYVTIPEKKILLVILCNTPRDIYAFTDKVFEVMGEK